MRKHPIRFELFSQFSSSTAAEARSGRISSLRHGTKTIETPNYFCITSRGVVPHITPDLIASQTQIRGVHLAIEDLIAFPDTSLLHQRTALPENVLTLLAPRKTPAVSTPTANSDSAISLFTTGGFKSLTNKEYIRHASKLSPDIVVALADVTHDSKPGAKRIPKMPKRTKDWVSELLLHRNPDQAIFAPILPISGSEQCDYLEYISDEAADQINGLAFYDSRLLLDVPATTATNQLVRLSLDEPSTPHEILSQISLGIDLLTIPFIGFATDAGIALTFRFPRPLGHEKILSDDENRTQPLGIDMWTSAHSASLTPLSDKCCCYACTFHHRAYIQHLLSAKEMLGWALLQIHNHHILSEFFTSVQKSIVSGYFRSDREEFTKIYASDLPEKATQGPRARGYNFKRGRSNNSKPTPVID